MLDLLRRQPSAILLAVQLAGVLLYPFMEDSDVRRALFSVFGIVVLGLVLLAVQARRWARGSRSRSRSPATILLLIQAVSGDDSLLRTRRPSKPSSTPMPPER